MIPRTVQSFYPERFERDMATTEAEWLSALPRAVGAFALSLAPGAARVQIGDGWLDLRWQPLPPRVIALMRLPRLGVAFAFEGVDEVQRQRFMKHFDLSTQRGGG